HHNVPTVKKPRVVKEASLQQIPEHQDRNLGDLFGGHATGVVSGVIGTSNGGLAIKARIFRALATQVAHVPSGLAGLTLLVKAIARALAGEECANDLPPEMSRR